MRDSLRWKLAGLLSATLVLASCGSGAKEPAGGRTLTVWDPFAVFGSGTPKDQENFNALVKQVDEEFAKTHPGVTIKHAHYGYDGYQQRLAAGVGANAAPDIAWVYGDLQWQLTDALDTRITPQQRKELTLIDQSIVAAPDRKPHVLPIGTYQGVWMYNKALFRKAGVTVPATQEQWLANCGKIAAAGIRPTQVSFGKGHQLDRYAALYAGQLITDIARWNDASTPYSRPEYKQGVQAVLDGLRPGCWGKDPTAGGTPGDSDLAFVSGQSAMNFATANIDVATIESKIGKGNLGVFLQPALPGSKGPSMDASLMYGVSLLRTSRNKDLAWAYMSLWASAGAQNWAWEKVGQVPNDTAATVSAKDAVNKQLLAWARENNPQFHVGAWPVNNKESTAYLQIAPSVVRGDVGVDSFLGQLQQIRAAR